MHIPDIFFWFFSFFHNIAIIQKNLNKNTPYL